MSDNDEIVLRAQAGEPVADDLEQRVLGDLARQVAALDRTPTPDPARELRRVRYVAHWIPIGVLDYEDDPDEERRAILTEHDAHGTLQAQLTAGGLRIVRCMTCRDDVWVAPWALDVEVA